MNAEAPRSETLQDRAGNVSNGLRVLVADDNPVDRKVLSTIVARAGYDVVNAVDGHDALAKFVDAQPDLVLLDALMPGKDGFAVAKEIKAASTERFVPIIFLTSLTEANELARCVEAGGDDFLSKPYNRTILEAKLSALERMREMQATLRAAHDEIARHHMQLVADQEAAKAVFDNVAHSRQLEAPYLRHSLSPLALFNGDVFLAARSPSEGLLVLLGDFTGHGLAAAIGALPLADVFYGMASKGFSLPEIVRECNRKLKSVLPSGYFCCATLMAIDFHRGTVEFWNGGVPSVYLKRVGRVVPLSSSNLPLGILSPDKFKEETQVMEVTVGDRLFMATDGVIEARDAEGEYFGSERLEAILEASAFSDLFDNVKTAVYGFMQQEARDDDITIIEVTIPAADEIDADLNDDVGALEGPKDWKLSYELGPESLKDFNPLPMLQQIVLQAPFLRTHTTEIYTVLAELYSNALEHGVLGLNSALKNSAEGFSQYYAQRAQALEQVEGFVRFALESRIDGDRVYLDIVVTDSGRGFDYASMQKRIRAADAPGRSGGYHGRGLALLDDLCSKVTFSEPGNRVQVQMEWSNLHV